MDIVSEAKALLIKSNEPDATLLCLVEIGDQQYNTYSTTKQEYLGVFASPLEKECSLWPAEMTIKGENPKILLREAKYYCSLISKSHPAMIELLFSKPIVSSPAWDELCLHREQFISFLGFAIGLLRKYNNYRRSVTDVTKHFEATYRALDTAQTLIYDSEFKSNATPLIEYTNGTEFDANTTKEQLSEQIRHLEAILETLPIPNGQPRTKDQHALPHVTNFDFLNTWLLNLRQKQPGYS